MSKESEFHWPASAQGLLVSLPAEAPATAGSSAKTASPHPQVGLELNEILCAKGPGWCPAHSTPALG